MAPNDWRNISSLELAWFEVVGVQKDQLRLHKGLGRERSVRGPQSLGRVAGSEVWWRPIMTSRMCSFVRPRSVHLKSIEGEQVPTAFHAWI